MQEKYRYGLWGAAAGAITLALVGFTWGGWVTGSTAKEQADAGWTALLPVCADAILASPAALAELKTKRTTDYDDVVRDHLKMIAGRADLSFAFRRDCGKTIEARLQSAAIKKIKAGWRPSVRKRAVVCHRGTSRQEGGRALRVLGGSERDDEAVRPAIDAKPPPPSSLLFSCERAPRGWLHRIQ